MHELLSYAVHGLANNWQNWATHFVLWLLAGGSVWLTTQVAKTVREWDKDTVIQRFAFIISTIGTIADYLVANLPTHFVHAQNPVWLAAIITGLFTTATFIHHTPLTSLISFLTGSVQPYFTAVKTIKEAKTAQTQPATQDTFQ